MTMIVIPLQSGSNGNSYYVESDRFALLIDAGISVSKAQARLAEHGRDFRRLKGLLITHDHGDHSRFLGSFHRKLNLPVYITEPTLRAVQQHHSPGRLERIRLFESGTSLSIEGLRIETLATPHDGVDGVVFIVDNGTQRVGIMTDLGHPFAELKASLPTLDGIVLESNYDENLLAEGAYPAHLKQRIRGSGGHISNREAANLLKEHNQGRLQWACLCHLSQQNNDPQLALQTHYEILGQELPLSIAWRDRVGQLLGF
jgi:phosphoribosyl 1,2-cyclic phosphodiesterase